MNAHRFTIEAIEFLERPVRFRLPFRFGASMLSEAPEAFARVTIRLAGASLSAMGAAAEMLMPKWFDMNPALDNDTNIDQLRHSLALARDAYCADSRPATAFAHHARHYHALLQAGAGAGLNPLLASYGAALIDRAVIDALARALGVSFFDLMHSNGAGFDPSLLLPEFAGFDADGFLAAQTPLRSLAARHTIGLLDPLDPLDDGPTAARVRDGLPRTLGEVIAAYGHRYFKIKVGGDVAADRARLVRIAAILDKLPEYRVTLDGNEQFDDAGALAGLWQAISAEPALTRLIANTLLVEQPIPRSHALSMPAPEIDVPLIIDESDGDLDAFPAARALGYRGVSSKSCKGLYKSLINRARSDRWNREAGSDRYFMSAEDLTTQAGLAVQQDLALVALLGIAHVERNGHHYVDGMAGLPEGEQRAFLAAHRDLYIHSHGATRLRIAKGALAIGSLSCTGFASGALPAWDAMSAMPAHSRAGRNTGSGIVETSEGMPG